MFNQSRIVERHESGEFTATPRTKSNPSKWPDHPKDTRSYYFTFRDAQGNEVATAHRYIGPHGFATAFDPKTLKIGDLRYTVHPDPSVANPETWFPFVWMRLTYGWVRRRIICPAFGPLDVLPMALLPTLTFASARLRGHFCRSKHTSQSFGELLHSSLWFIGADVWYVGLVEVAGTLFQHVCGSSEPVSEA